MQINTSQYYWLSIFISIFAGMSNCLNNFMLSNISKACISMLGNDEVRQIGHNQNTAE